MINVEKEIGGKMLTLQTGKIARQSAGSVVLTYGETVLLVAVNAAKEAREDVGFFPLQVEYREKHYASGKIPGGFFKREARPTEGEVLTSRLTDRPIRPLFPKSFKNETQVIITVLQSDGENISDTGAGVGASSALLISDIIKYGEIKFYSDIAKELKSSPRAVGNACGKNKCLIIIPCHRIVSKNVKNSSGYSSFGGLIHKNILLSFEKTL